VFAELIPHYSEHLLCQLAFAIQRCLVTEIELYTPPKITKLFAYYMHIVSDLKLFCKQFEKCAYVHEVCGIMTRLAAPVDEVCDRSGPNWAKVGRK
jgi:hypothetical protein